MCVCVSVCVFVCVYDGAIREGDGHYIAGLNYSSAYIYIYI